MKKNTKEITFIDSYSADTAIVPKVINALIEDLKTLGYSQDDIDEIVLSMDESITNAIQETLVKRENSKHSETCREITVRYTINDAEFDATVIDQGCGLDIAKSLKELPDECSNDYFEQIIDYAEESEKNKLKVRINGCEIPLKGIGTGLKIILKFMDTVTIDLIDKKKFLTDSVSDSTDGTILNMRRARKH
ncbi:ATP-binding protein [Spirochaetota bacterium]